MHGFEDRTKVVFAGLHSVQRYAKVSNNTFKHLAQRPTVIGPLQAAIRLRPDRTSDGSDRLRLRRS